VQTDLPPCQAGGSGECPRVNVFVDMEDAIKTSTQPCVDAIYWGSDLDVYQVCECPSRSVASSRSENKTIYFSLVCLVGNRSQAPSKESSNPQLPASATLAPSSAAASAVPNALSNSVGAASSNVEPGN
jgi:hypothetical protein